jgi:putative transposase
MKRQSRRVQASIASSRRNLFLTSKSIYKAFKFRLYPTHEQEVFFEKSVGCSRFVYNKLLEANIAEYKNTGKFILGFSLTNKLVELKKQYPWLKEVNSQSLQQASINLATAFKNRFSKKRKKQTGFPQFKKRSNQDSFAVPQHFNVKKNQIKLPKVGWVACITHRKLEGKVKSITVSKDVDVWFVSILCELPEKVSYYDPTNAVGIDLGIKSFAVTSDGECIDAPDLIKEYKKLKKLQRIHAKKQKGGKNKEKARRKVARQHRKIRRINKNFVETTSSLIAKDYDVVSIENLNIQGMKANRKLAPSIQKLSWGFFVGALQRKVPVVHRVSRWYPSSKTCSCCGWIKKDLTLCDRTFNCSSCGFELDRDANAAINLLNEWKRTVATAGIACGEDVRPDVGTCSSKRQTSVKQEYEFIGTQAVNALA